MMDMRQIPLVVVGAHTVGVGVIRAMQGFGAPIHLVYYDSKDMGIASKYPVARYEAPHPEHQESKFIEFLLNLAQHTGRSLLVPASDASLASISRHKSELETKYIVACTEWAIAELFINKKNTYELAEEIGVPAPRTRVPQSVEDVIAYTETIDFPCLVKPCQGHRYFEIFETKMVRVENKDQMVKAYLAAAEHNLEIMLQEIIPGEAACGANYNAYFWDGTPLVEFTARKLRNAPPDFGSPCALKSAVIPEVLEPGRKILQRMGFYGYACSEFKRDPRDGIYKLMEVNGRHNLSSLLAVHCGINFPRLQYEHLVFGVEPKPTPFQSDIYWVDLTRDCYYHLREGLRSKAGRQDFFEPYRKEHIFALLDKKDLGPFIKRCKELIRHGMQSGSQRTTL